MIVGLLQAPRATCHAERGAKDALAAASGHEAIQSLVIHTAVSSGNNHKPKLKWTRHLPEAKMLAHEVVNVQCFHDQIYAHLL